MSKRPKSASRRPAAPGTVSPRSRRVVAGVPVAVVPVHDVPVAGVAPDRHPLGRKRVRTPRELAAVLNPDLVRPTAAPAESAAEPSTAAPVSSPEPRRTFRERVAGREGRAELLVFRVGGERFGTDLAAIEEAVDQIDAQPIPDMPPTMLGVFRLRERMLAVFAPQHALHVALECAEPSTIVMRTAHRRIGIAVDDIEDVVDVDLATLRHAPGVDDADGVLLAVAWRGADLISVLDADALVACCVADLPPESA